MTSGPQVGREIPAHCRAPIDALKQAISGNTIRLCLESYRGQIGAIVLTGSLARNEATFVREDPGWRALGDADFLVVFDERNPLPQGSAIERLANRIEQSLSREGVICHIGLSTVDPAYFRKLPPHIFSYELRNCAEVVWGSGSVLSLIPGFSASDIWIEYAWRLLSNRIVEQLEAALHPPSAYYRGVKLYLDMATSFLVFAGAYEPTYEARAQRLRSLAEATGRADRFPFPMQDFSERVNACTAFKLCGGDPGELLAGGETAFWEEAVRYAKLLWHWELSQLLGKHPLPSEGELLRMWMRAQPFRKKLRGWLFVLRKCGWHRSWQHWPRWAARALRASPRYFVYEAASELLFRLPELSQDARPRPECERLRQLLPLIPNSIHGGKESEWRELAWQIAWNYHQFLEGTRT